MKPRIQCVPTQWNPGFIAFADVRQTFGWRPADVRQASGSRPIPHLGLVWLLRWVDGSLGDRNMGARNSTCGGGAGRLAWSR
jgi:hypothetical protein